MSITNTQEKERKNDNDPPEIITMLPLEDETEAQDEPVLLLQTYHLTSMKSTVVIRQLPSKGLSFQLWPAATALVNLIDHHTTTTTTTFSKLLINRAGPRPLCILELGSGTGMVGIAAAAILGAHVTVTDLAHVIPNLKFNTEANSSAVMVNGGKVEVAKLGWGESEDMESIKEEEYDIIMGSDVVYHDHLYEPLLQTLRFFLLGNELARKRVFVMAHLKRWKKESGFFKKASKDFIVEVIHRDDPCNGARVGVLVYTFVAKDKNKEKLQVSNCG